MKKEKIEESKVLYRTCNERMLGGVCSGIAGYLNVDPTAVRIIWAAGTVFWGFGTMLWGSGLILYLIAWLIIPAKPY